MKHSSMSDYDVDVIPSIIATGRSDKIMRSYEYMAANVEAANIDLKAWTT